MNTLRETLYNTIHRNHKPLKQIAEDIGMSENYLVRAALPDPEEAENGTGCRFPLKKLIPLIQSTGDYSVLDRIEDAVGRVAIPVPKSSGCSSDICRNAMQAVKEFGELMARLDVSIADGKLTAAEIAAIHVEGYEAIQAVTNLLHNLKGK